MNLDELERLAKAATPGPWIETLTANADAVDDQASLLVGPDRQLMKQLSDRLESAADYIAACSPDVILRLLNVVRAADAMRSTCVILQARQWESFDAARAQLEQQP